MKNRIFIMVMSAILITGCFVQSKKYWDSENKKVEECRSKWIYKNLEKEQEVTVLLFSAKFNRGVSSFPNFLIVLTKENDIIAFLDKDFDDEIKVGSKINLSPLQWNDAEKSIKKPAFIVQKKSKENDLYCRVREVYYGKLKLIKATQ